MLDEVYFLHHCFADKIEDVKSLLDSFGYGVEEPRMNKDIGLQIMERDGYNITWWHKDNCPPWMDTKQPIYSNVELMSEDRDPCFTEIKITCSYDPCLLLHLEKLAVFIWPRLNQSDHELTLPHPEIEPYFKSYKDYLIRLEEAKEDLERLFPSEQNEILSTEVKNRSHKSGPATYSDTEKLAALEEWRDLPEHTKTLQEWLIDKFETDDKNIPKVLDTTFHSWRRSLRKKGLYEG